MTPPQSISFSYDDDGEMRPIWGSESTIFRNKQRRTYQVTTPAKAVFQEEGELVPVWGAGGLSNVPKTNTHRTTVVPTRVPKRKSTTIPPLVH